MDQSINDEKIATSLGTYKISIRKGKKMVVFLNGASSFDTEQTFDPIIVDLPKQVGIFALDYINSGLSSQETHPFILEEETKIISGLIRARHAEKIIIVAHSIGGLYALHIAPNLNNLAGFVGIEPTTREVTLNTPTEPAYKDAEEAAAKLTEEELNAQVKKRVYKYFSKTLADKIWQTHLLDETREVDSITKLLNQNFDDTFKKYPDRKLAKNLPVILFTQSFRVNEYKRSEYFTDDARIKPLGTFHYIHWEFPNEVGNAIKEILDKI